MIAPSLIPVAPGARLKTDKRDARRLVQLYRAGELVPVRVPTPEEEAVRDLCRARTDVVIERVRARHRLSKFLLRHGEVYRAGRAWTIRHDAWLESRHFDNAALEQTYLHYRAMLVGLDAQLRAIESDLALYFESGPFVSSVDRLGAYRGVSRLGALSLAAEVGDWRRFPRPTAFMGFCGLVPSEYSSGERTRRSGITKTGNTHLRAQLVEAAWAYQHRPAAGTTITARQANCDKATVARAWAAQLHLCAKFRRLAERKQNRKVVVTAVARELAGFLHAEMVA